jgi:hypothetical protein
VLWQEADGLGNLLGFANEVRQTGLAVFGLDEVISSIVICNQVALEAGTEDLQSHFAGTGAINVEEAEIGIAGKPDVRTLAVNAPVGLIGMNGIGRADLIAQLFMNGFGGARGRLIKSHGGSGYKRESEELREDFAHISIREPELVAEENGGGFGVGANLAVAQLSLGGLKDRTPALRAEGGVMLIGRDDGLGLDDDVFLNLFVRFSSGLQADGGAVRTDSWGGHPERAVDSIRDRPVPWGMSARSTTFAASLWIARWLGVRLEAGGMLSFKASPQLGVFLFQTLVIGLEGSDLLRGSPDVVLVAKGVATGIGYQRVGPFGGNTAQVRTGIPIRTLKTVGGFFRAAHNPAGKLVREVTASLRRRVASKGTSTFGIVP